MDSVTLGLEWFLNPDHIPFYVADERGYYADEGLELEVWEPPEHYETLEMLAAGELDFAITEPIHLIPERAAGVPVQGIAEFLDTPGGIQYPTNRGWETPADLPDGVRLNYPGAPEPEGRRMVAAMIRHAGGDHSADDIEPVDRGFYHTDALIEDDADIAFLAFHNFEVVESRHRDFDTALWELDDYGLPDFSRLILTASDETLDTAPDRVEGFLRATRRGVETTRDEPETAIETFFERNPEVREDDPELLDAIARDTVERFTADFSQATGMYADLAEFAVDIGLADERVPVSAVADERFA
ncbi:ABC transporter substrate-binding protein [Halosegnis longus]|uniref:ABC transporter substrate-binding protein n=1 Tax=Halosegnis longus TaxID=2216012 RepID=UPI00129EF825|nr:ABC transporter substrate-binding protein [Halosegnis longus]